MPKPLRKPPSLRPAGTEGFIPGVSPIFVFPWVAVKELDLSYHNMDI